MAITESLPRALAPQRTSNGNYIASNNVVLVGAILRHECTDIELSGRGPAGRYPARVSWSVDGVSGSETTGTNLVIAGSG